MEVLVINEAVALIGGSETGDLAGSMLYIRRDRLFVIPM